MGIVEINKYFFQVLIFLMLFLVRTSPHAAGTSQHNHSILKNIGEPGKKSEISRKINVTMFDNYFVPSLLNLKKGETIHFVIKNSGELVHEFNIATKEMHKDHIPEMVAMIEHGVIEGDKINWEAAKLMQKKNRAWNAQ